MAGAPVPVEPGWKIEDGLHTMGPMKRGMSRGAYSRAYLFEDGDKLTLVDTLFESDARLIIEYLWSIGRSPTELTDIVLTHSHRSHLGGVAALQRLSGATVHCHDTEVDIVEGRAVAGAMPLRPLRPLVVMPFRVATHMGGGPPHGRPKVNESLHEGKNVGSLEVLHVPGHTPGHVALYWKRRALFVGDAIMSWPNFSAGWPMFNLDEATYRRSLWRLISMEPEIVGPGHGEPICDHTPERLATLVSYPPW